MPCNGVILSCLDAVAMMAVQMAAVPSSNDALEAVVW